MADTQSRQVLSYQAADSAKTEDGNMAICKLGLPGLPEHPHLTLMIQGCARICTLRRLSLIHI